MNLVRLCWERVPSEKWWLHLSYFRLGGVRIENLEHALRRVKCIQLASVQY